MRAHLLAVAVLLTTLSGASADAPYSGYKDAAEAEQYRGETTSYRRASDDNIRNYLTKEEMRQLKRIKRNAESRRNGRKVSRQATRAYAIQPARYDREPRTVYVERREDDRRSLYVRDGGKECRAPIDATSEERGWRGRALRDAQDKWTARAIANHGYKYGNLEKARGAQPDCNPIRKNKFGVKIWVCEFRARPCKDL